MTAIWIVGLGMQTATQITRQAELAMRASQEVLYLDTGIATRAYLETLCPRVTSLFEESYVPEGLRVQAYEHMAARVVEAAMDHGPVTFAIHGHPLVAVTAPFLVLDLAAALDLKVEVLPGISAFDAIMADLRVDPVLHGIQMYEATDLMLRRRPLQADVPALLWQIGPLETCLHSMAVARPERYARLVAHLLQYYPPRHEVVAIHSSPHPVLPPQTLRFAIEDMGQHAHEFHAGFTLYVPATGMRPIQDHELLAGLYSVEHLRSITRD